MFMTVCFENSLFKFTSATIMKDIKKIIRCHVTNKVLNIKLQQ